LLAPPGVSEVRRHGERKKGKGKALRRGARTIRTGISLMALTQGSEKHQTRLMRRGGKGKKKKKKMKKKKREGLVKSFSIGLYYLDLHSRRNTVRRKEKRAGAKGNERRAMFVIRSITLQVGGRTGGYASD